MHHPGVSQSTNVFSVSPCLGCFSKSPNLFRSSAFCSINELQRVARCSEHSLIAGSLRDPGVYDYSEDRSPGLLGAIRLCSLFDASSGNQLPNLVSRETHLRVGMFRVHFKQRTLLSMDELLLCKEACYAENP